MFNQGILPSRNLPAHIRRDLGVGSQQNHPLVRALDGAFLEILSFRQTQTLAHTCHLASIERQKAILTTLGFTLDGLSTTQLSKLFSIRTLFLKESTSLDVLWEVASIFFEELLVEVSRGRSVERIDTRARLTFPIQVGDRTQTDRIVHIRLSSATSPEVHKSFEMTFSQLVPPLYTLLITANTETKKAEVAPFSGWGTKMSLVRRKL
jgi:hypothetical protein